MIFVQTINDELEQLVDVKLVNSCYTMLELDIEQQTRRAAYSSQNRKTANKKFLIFAVIFERELSSMMTPRYFRFGWTLNPISRNFTFALFPPKQTTFGRGYVSVCCLSSIHLYSPECTTSLHSSPIHFYNQRSISFNTVTLLVSKQRHIQLTVRWALITYIMKIKIKVRKKDSEEAAKTTSNVTSFQSKWW